MDFFLSYHFFLATSVTINNPMNFPATPAWSLGLCPAQSSLYTCTSAHVCISLCFPAAPAFPPKESIHKEFVQSFFLNDFIHSSLSFHSPSSVPHPAHHPELTYTMLTCGQLASPAFVQMSSKYLCTFSCSTSISLGKSSPQVCRCSTGPSSSSSHETLCSLPKHPHMTTWLPQLVDHTPFGMCFPTLWRFPPLVPDLSFLFHFCVKGVSPFAVQLLKSPWGNACFIGVLLPCEPGLSGALSVSLTFSVSWFKFCVLWQLVPLCLNPLSHVLPK